MKLRKKALESRDRKILRKIDKLDAKIINLERKADKTVPPKLREQMIKAFNNWREIVGLKPVRK